MTLAFICWHTPVLAKMEHSHGGTANYAGQEKRDIKSLSAQDIDDLLNGRGWGFAKAAELNGLPGPIHLLELKQQVGLSAEQTVKIETLYAEMKAQAVPLGRTLVELERQLDQAFSKNNMTQDALMKKLTAIEATRRQLRFVHLAAHLQTPQILTPHQIHQYNNLRGYSSHSHPKH